MSAGEPRVSQHGSPARRPSADSDVSTARRRQPVSRIGTIDPESARAIARLGQILDHPLRVQILQALVKEPNSAVGLAPTLEVPLNSVSYHLNEVLDRRYRVVDVLRTNQKRGAEETVYRVNADALLGDLIWPEERHVSSTGLKGAALAAFLSQALAALESGSLESRKEATAHWRPAAVDETGLQEIAEVMQQATERVEAAVRASTERGEENRLSTVVGLAFFEAAPLEAGGPEGEQDER